MDDILRRIRRSPWPVRRRRLVLVVVILLLVWLWTWAPEDAAPGPDTPGPVGIWITEGDNGSPFRYDGKYVTIELGPRWAWEWRHDDLYWRLESEWAKNDFFVRFPYGNWELFGRFVDGRFQREDGRLYKKVGCRELSRFFLGLLRKRPPCDYSLNPSERKRKGDWIYLVPYCFRPWVGRHRLRAP